MWPTVTTLFFIVPISFAPDRYVNCTYHLFTKRQDVLPPNLVKSRSRDIGYHDDRIALKFDRHLGSVAVEVPIKLQSDFYIHWILHLADTFYIFRGMLDYFVKLWITVIWFNLIVPKPVFWLNICPMNPEFWHEFIKAIMATNARVAIRQWVNIGCKGSW